MTQRDDRSEPGLEDRTEVRRTDVDAILEVPVVVARDEASRPIGTDGRPGMPTREELAAQLVGQRGNISRLAAFYGKDAKQIYRWLKRYRLDPGGYR